MKHLLTTLLIGLLLMSTAQAQRPGAGQHNGLDRAVRQVEKRTGGQVLSAERRRIDGRIKYRIKVLTPRGRVRIIYRNANAPAAD